MPDRYRGSNRAPQAQAGGRRTRYLIVTFLALVAGALMTSSALATLRGERSMVPHRAISPGPGFRTGRAPRTAAGSVARAAGINSVVPAFKIEFAYNVRGSRLQLTRFSLFPFYSRFEELPSGGCLRCAGSGTFSTPRLRGHVLSEVVKGGTRYMSRRTIFVESVTSADEIGRFTVYGLNVSAATPRPIVRASGCTPAGLALTNEDVLNWRRLPRVPCAGRTPRGDRVSISTPLELSSTTRLQGTITGHASESEWLIAFESQNGVPCAPSALTEELRTTVFVNPLRVRGNFAVRFKTALATTPGFQCAYLQTGGLVTLSRSIRLPDGRVSARSRWAFFAGDTLSISTPPTAAVGSSPQIIVSGAASADEELYVFAPYTPCAGTAQAEYQADPLALETPEKRGRFAQPVQLQTLSPPPGATTVYECAYLQLFAPSGKAPTGPTLAFSPSSLTLTP